MAQTKMCEKISSGYVPGTPTTTKDGTEWYYGDRNVNGYVYGPVAVVGYQKQNGKLTGIIVENKLDQKRKTMNYGDKSVHWYSVNIGTNCNDDGSSSAESKPTPNTNGGKSSRRKRKSKKSKRAKKTKRSLL
jgi:hypothetical protein